MRTGGPAAIHERGDNGTIRRQQPFGNQLLGQYPAQRLSLEAASLALIVRH